MTMILVDPRKRIIAADKRVCFGHMYRDTEHKIAKAGGVVVAVAGSPKLLTFSVGYLQGLESEFDLSDFVSSLGEAFSSGEENNEDEIPGSVIVAYQGKVCEIDGSLTVLRIRARTAFGSGTEAGQALLDYGLEFSEIFKTVAKSNFTVSKTYTCEKY